MQTHALGALGRFEVSIHRIGNHRVQFRERVALRGDTAFAGLIVPTRDKSAGFGAWGDGECDFFHQRETCRDFRNLASVTHVFAIVPISDFCRILLSAFPISGFCFLGFRSGQSETFDNWFMGLSGHGHKYDDVRGEGFFAQTRRERRAYPAVDL
jgi:hypothetical protein